MSFDILGTIIISLFGFITIRDLIAYMGWMPRDKKWSWIIYGRYDEKLLISIFKKLGLEKREVEKGISLVGRLNKNKVEKPLERLLYLVSKYIYNTNEILSYGRVSRVTTKFYVNLMEAVHDTGDLNLMCSLLKELIIEKVERRFPDFVVTPKIGNPILSKKFCETEKIMWILRKGEQERSRAYVHKEDYVNNFKINFEGSRHLLQLAEKREDRKLYGVIIDCNASGASEIFNTMKEFNEIVRLSGVNIELIKEAFILMRPDHKEPVDEKFGNKLFRFFDLDEELKSELASMSGKVSKSNTEKISGLIKKLRDKGLLKWDL